MKYTMNIFDDDGFVGNMQANTMLECERLAKIELDCGNAVEVFESVGGVIVKDYAGTILKTDSDGFFGR